MTTIPSRGSGRGDTPAAGRPNSPTTENSPNSLTRALLESEAELAGACRALAMSGRLRDLTKAEASLANGAERAPTREHLERIISVEIDPLAALMARACLTAAGLDGRSRVIVGDYRAAPIGKAPGRTAFVGNPPYVRHHDIDARWKHWYASVAAERGLRMRRVSSRTKLGSLESGAYVSKERLAGTSRWTSLLGQPRRATPQGFVELGELYRVHRGAVTGSNATGITGHSDSRPTAAALPPSVLFPAVTSARELFMERITIPGPALLSQAIAS